MKNYSIKKKDMKKIIQKNKHNVYAYQEGNLIHFSEFKIEMKNNYTSAPKMEVLNNMLKNLKKCRSEIEKRIEVVENQINNENQLKVFYE